MNRLLKVTSEEVGRYCFAKKGLTLCTVSEILVYMLGSGLGLDLFDVWGGSPRGQGQA